MCIPFDDEEERTEPHTALITERNTKQQNAKAQEKLFVNLRKAKKKKIPTHVFTFIRIM